MEYKRSTKEHEYRSSSRIQLLTCDCFQNRGRYTYQCSSSKLLSQDSKNLAAYPESPSARILTSHRKQQ